MPKRRRNEQQTRNVASLLPVLEELGFYKYVPSSQVQYVKLESVHQATLFPDPTHLPESSLWRIIDPQPDLTRRAYYVDAEDLLEQGAEVFFDEAAPILAEHGIVVRDRYDGFSEGTYWINVNGVRYVQYTSSGDVPQTMPAALGAFATINWLLKDAQCEERVYYRYGGNDTQMLFLTPQMFSTIMQSGSIKASEQIRPVPESTNNGPGAINGE